MAALGNVRLLGSRGPLILNLKCTNGINGVSVVSAKSRLFSTTSRDEAEKKYKLLVVGGGAAGSSIAHTFTHTLGKGEVAVLEPSSSHYYQPLWTLVGGGLRKFEHSKKTQHSILPKNADWVHDSVESFDPENNLVHCSHGETIKYDYLLVSVGIFTNYDVVDGLTDALQNDPRVCSNYHPEYVQKTFPALQNFKGGNAIFTFPNTPIKCAGAPQKIAYLADDYFRRSGKRETANIMYNTSLPVIFGIPRYAKVLKPLCEERNIAVNYRHNLVAVDRKKSQATFELLEEPGNYVDFKYNFLHVGPPCSPPQALVGSPISDQAGFVDVDPHSLQHKKYSNIFGMGDCNNAPTAKTAAAVASQSGIVVRNLKKVMKGESIADTPKYDGYTSCPIMIAKNECILAEFGYDGSILETFPWDQTKKSVLASTMKKFVLPEMYFRLAVRGLWHGPKVFRKMFNVFTPPKS